MQDRKTREIAAAIEHGTRAYFNECRGRVKPFIKEHFRYPSAWHTNKKAWGWDLLRSPCNLFWAPVYVLVMLLAWGCRKLGAVRLGNWLEKMPAGLSTAVQRHIAHLIFTDLLQRSNEAGEDRLEQHIVAALEPLAGPHGGQGKVVKRLEPVVHDALNQYAVTRTASADITNSLLSTAAGAFAFKKFTPGGLAIGVYIAAVVSHHSAVSNFWLGETLGRLYYGLFPPTPSLGLSTVSVLAVLALLAVFASFSGLIIDPIQSWTGLHKRRLNKMLDSLERDFIDGLERNVMSSEPSGGRGSFRPKEPFVARLLEIIDAAKSQLF